MATVLEELIAKIGFKVDGLNKVDDAKKKIDSFSSSLNKRLSGLRFDLITRGFEKLGVQMNSGFSTAATRLTSFAGTLVRIGALVAGLAAGFAAAALSALGLSYAIVKVAGEAAKLRRQQIMDAKSKGTSAINIDKLTGAFGLMGVDNASGAASGAVGAVFDKMAEARKGPGEARDWFRKNRISTGDRFGPRDSGEVTADIIKGYLDARNKRDEARDQAKADPNNRKKGRAFTAAQDAFDKFLDGMPALGDALRQNLDQIKNWQEFVDKANKSAEIKPPRTKEEDENALKLAAKYNELMAKLEGILASLKPNLDTLALNIVGPLNTFADTIIEALKLMGVIPRTKAEMAAQSNTGRNAAESKGVQDALAQADASNSRPYVPGSGQVNLAEAVLREAAKDYRDTLGRAQQTGDYAAVGRAAAALERAAQSLREAQSEQKNAPEAPGTLESIGNWLKSFMSTAKPTPKEGEGLGKRTEINYDNSGNDQRKFSNTVSVNVASAQQVAAEVRQQLAAANAKIGPTAAKLGSTTGAPAAV